MKTLAPASLSSLPSRVGSTARHWLGATVAVALIGAWLSWDFLAVCGRTFLLGHSLRRQLDEIQSEEGNA